jgi:hypothetical protein
MTSWQRLVVWCLVLLQALEAAARSEARQPNLLELAVQVCDWARRAAWQETAGSQGPRACTAHFLQTSSRVLLNVLSSQMIHPVGMDVSLALVREEEKEEEKMEEEEDQKGKYN